MVKTVLWVQEHFRLGKPMIDDMNVCMYVRMFLCRNTWFGIKRMHWECSLVERVPVALCCSRQVYYVFSPVYLACEGSYLVDPASSHMLVSKIKPCMSKYKHLYCETANGSLNQLSFIWLYFTTWIPVVILELIHAKNPNFWKGCIY